MPVYDPATAPFDKPAAKALDPSQVRFDDGSYAVEPSILSETLKAPARVIGGFAQEAGEMAQYATGDRAGMGIRKWGEGVQERNAQTPAFREAHPLLSAGGDVAEGVAKMAPYLAADVALSAVAPEAGLPAAAGLVARGIRAAKAAPFAATVLPAVAGLAQGQRSYEKGVANGLTPDQALAASYAPAAVTGAGMAAMGAMSEGLQGVGGAAKSLKGQFVKHAAADTAIMMGQGVATTAAEKATGIDPNAKPLDQLKDPKAWLNAALTGGMFAGLGVAKKGMIAKAIKEHVDKLSEAAPEERVAFVEALAQAVHPEDPAAQSAFQADTLDKIQAGEPVISEEIVNQLTKETPETTRESVLEGLKTSVESGGEIDPIEAHNAVEEGKVVEALKNEAPAWQAAPEEPVKMQEASMPGVSIPPEEPAEPVALTRARRWLKDGFTEAREGSEPDAEVAAHLDDMGYTLVKGERADRTAGGNVARREWRVEKKAEPEPAPTEHLAPESAPVAEATPEVAPAEQSAYSPLKDREQRLAYEDNPNLVVGRKGDHIALIDQKEGKLIGKAELKGDKFHQWSDGFEPDTPLERVEAERIFRRHMGEEARLNRGEGTGLSKAEVEDHLSEIVKNLKVPVEVVNHAGEISGLREDAPKFNGAFHNGKIYLNAEHLTSLKEAEHVLLKHELAHAGLRGALGEKGLNEVLAKAWGDVNSGVREFAKEKGIETRTKAGKLEATEEYLVHLAEQGTKHPLWDKFVATLKAAMRKLGFDMKYSDAELRSLVVEAARSMTSEKAEATATRLSRVVADTRTPDAADEISSKITAQTVKRVLSNASGDIMRAIMPLDKTMTMGASMKEYAPISHQFERLQELAHRKRAAGSAPSIDAEHLRDDYGKVLKTEAATNAYNDLTNKASLYQLHADPSKPIPWTEKTWKESGHAKGVSLGQAVKEVRALWAKLTPEQREVQQRAVAHMKALKAQEIEALIDVLKANPLNTPIFDKAEKIAETFHAKMWKAEQIGGAEEAGRVRAELSTLHGADVVDLAEEIAATRSEGQLKGDYAPLMRYGDHAVTIYEKTEGGAGKRLSYHREESQLKAEALVAKARAEGKFVEYEYDDIAARAKANIPPAFMDKLRRGLEAQGITGEAQERIMQDFAAARVSSMPRVTLAGNKLNREGVAGYDTDALRAYATYVRNASRAIANLKYGYKIEQEFRDMRNNIKAYQDPEKEWSVNNVQRMTSLQSLLETAMTSSNEQRINNAVKTLGKTTFLWYLTSPSVWAVQWSQPFITTIPKMASRYGFGTAFSEYVKGAKNHMAGRYSDEKIDAFDRKNNFVGKQVFDLIEKYQDAATKEEKEKLSKEMLSVYNRFTPVEQELLLLKVMSHQGGIDLSAAHSQDDLINSSNIFDRGMDKAIDKLGIFMRASETGSRRAAAVSAFALALKEHKNGPEAFMKANKYANHVINDTLFDFDSANRPAWMKGNVGRVVGQFQFFRTHMLGKTVQLAKDAIGRDFDRMIKEAGGDQAKIAEAKQAKSEARKELAYMMGTSMALAGAGGTPLAMLASNTLTDAIWGAASYLFGDPDDPWDPKADFENALKDAVGDTATNTFYHGLPYLMGMDVSKRVGLGGMADMIQGDIPAGATSTDKANWYAAKILGPSWGLATSAIKTVDAFENGDYGTAMQAGSPKVLRDFMKAYDVSQDGVRGPGGRTVLQAEDVSPFSVALQMVGINPSDISLAQDEAREFKNATTELKQRRSLLMKRVTDATLAGDMDAREEALQAVNAWGEKQPALKISVRELANSVKRGMDLKAGKMSKQDERLKEEGL